MKVRLIPLWLILVGSSCNITSMVIHQSDDSYYNATGAHSVADQKQTSKNDNTPSFITPTVGAIYWKNPSFEENTSASHSTIPYQWESCDDEWSSPPDIHSNKTKYFQVTQMSSHGDKFLGMVVRADGTHETIVQELDSHLRRESAYRFEIDLSLSSRLISLSRSTMKEENFNQPAVLRVWGGTTLCDKSELLYKTTAVNHSGWKSYTIELYPSDDYKFITLEAFYNQKGAVFSYNGNLMIDNLSPIVKIEE